MSNGGVLRNWVIPAAIIAAWWFTAPVLGIIFLALQR